MKDEVKHDRARSPNQRMCDRNVLGFAPGLRFLWSQINYVQTTKREARSDGESINPDCDLEGLQAGCSHNVLSGLGAPVSNGRG